MVMGVVGALLITGFVMLSTRLAAPHMSLLFADLTVEDAGSIVGRLETMNVPFELSNQGRNVHVPEDQVLRLRLTMAEEGLPSGGSLGYELFDRNDSLGTTSFVQNLNHLRALEGELARTIQTIDRVAAARVHLVLPRRELFSRDKPEPSASIILKLRGGSRLGAPQVQAIQHLISSAVPDLEPSRVSIVDGRGNLLSRGEEEGATAGASRLADLQLAYENRLKHQIEGLVEQSVGAGRVRAQVSAVMNFDRVTTNSEEYDPESQVARSTQTIEETASSNEANVDKTVTVGNNLPTADTEATPGDTSASQSERVEETVNYEISRTVQTRVHESGTVNRLSVAVLIDGVYETAEDGQSTYSARSEEELTQIAALVKSSIGFDEARGDVVEVISMQFVRPDDVLDGLPLEEGFLGLNKGDLFRIGEIVAFVIVALLAMLLVLRPLIAAAFAPPPEPETPQLPGPGGHPQLTHAEAEKAMLANPEIIAAIESGEMSAEEARAMVMAQVDGGGDAGGEEEDVGIDLDKIEGRVKESSIRKLGELVDKHPEDAVAVFRSWMYQES